MQSDVLLELAVVCRLWTVVKNSPLSKLKLINKNFVDNPVNLIYI